ncbi:hypothetical protein RD792_001336 [Penstemon davidsonii]|uniref:Peptidase A1 domain-containing protein n=1 Tax=Penstemon davidsonii TaxID=160366 RepID=A0ABR0DNT4_9LAMI|nr:hypothetical protein RD792_001336 [Penstemon davidsonii]
MGRSISRSPSYSRRRYSRSRSPAVSHRSRRSTRRDRTRSPHIRRRSRSGTPRRRRSRSPALRRRKSRSPTPRRHRRHRSRTPSLSPSPKSRSPSSTSADRKYAAEKLRKEEEAKKRLQHEAELKQLEEETAKRLEEEIRKRVEEKLGSEEVRLETERRIKEGKKKLFDDVEAQLQKEKEAALAEARQKEEQARKEREELDKMLEENRRRVEEAQRREALELQRKEEERLRELGLIQRQKEEVLNNRKITYHPDPPHRVGVAGTPGTEVLVQTPRDAGSFTKVAPAKVAASIRTTASMSSYDHDDTSNKMITCISYFCMRSIGTPPLLFSAILDTGSDLTWLPCLQCFNLSTPLFNPLYNGFHDVRMDAATLAGVALVKDPALRGLEEDLCPWCPRYTSTRRRRISMGWIRGVGTYLEDNTFHMLKKELISQIQFPVVENDTVLELCFNLSLDDHEDSTIDKLPKLIFNFQGGVDLELIARKYMIGVSTEVSCLTMGTTLTNE